LGFPVSQLLRQERCKFYAPLAQRLVADLTAALLKEFLDVTLAEENDDRARVRTG